MFWLSLALSCVHPTPLGASPAELNSVLPELVLVSGEPGLKLVAVISAGSAHDPIGEEGLAWRTAVALSRDTNASVQVDRELVTFVLEGEAGDAGQLASEMSRILKGLALDTLEARPALEAAEPAPMDLALGQEILNRWLYTGHPYGHPIQGLENRGDPQAFHAAHYRRQGIHLGLTGAVEESMTAPLIATMRGLSTTPHEAHTPQAVEVVRGRQLLVVHGIEHALSVEFQPPLQSVNLHLGRPLPSAGSPREQAALALAVAALGEPGPPHTRLARAGLSTDASAQIIGDGRTNGLRRQSHLQISLAEIPPEDLAGTLETLLTLLSELAETGLGPQEFQRVRSHFLHSMAVPTLEAQLANRALGLPMLSLAELEAVELAEVNRVLREQLNPRALRIVVQAPNPATASLAMALEGFDRVSALDLQEMTP